MALTREEFRAAIKETGQKVFFEEALREIIAVRDHLGSRQLKGEDFNPSLSSLDYAIICLKSVGNLSNPKED